MIRELWRNVGLQARIFLALQLVALPFLIFVFYSAYQQQRTERLAFEQRSVGLARLISARLDDKIGDLESLSAAFSVAAMVDQDHIQINDAFLARLKNDAPSFANNIAVWNLDGNNVGALDPQTRTSHVNVSDRAYFRDALTHSGWVSQSPIKSRSNGAFVAQFARAVADPDGKPVGVVTASAALSDLQGVIEPTGALPQDAVLTVINDDGMILARSQDPEKWVGKQVPDLVTFQAVRAQPVGVSTRRSLDGIERVLAHSTATHVAWTVYVGVPVADIEAPIRANTLRFIAVGAGIVIAASALALAIARTVVQPLQALANSARRFGSGELSHRAALMGPPESRRLALTFNKVAEELQQRTERLIHLSEVDLLTGLPNRRRFEDELLEAVHRCNFQDEQAALLFLDVDHFKSINDTLGHEEGDRALRVLADRLNSCIHSDDLAARLGGDEFVVLLRVPSEQHALVVADRIREAMKEPVDFIDAPLIVSVSIGIAMYLNGTPAAEFLKEADRALYAAKSERPV